MDVLVAEGLCGRVEGRALFDGLDLIVPEREIVAVTGPSGSGKTTLLRVIAGLHVGWEGRLRLRGECPSQMGWPRWRARVTYVPQQVPALAGTPREWFSTVEAYRSRTHGRVDDPVGIAASWNLPEERWSRPWAVLSGGERQRILLATALAFRPDLLLLDEPTGMLDRDATAAVETALQGRPAVWVTHDLAQAARLTSMRVTLS